MSFNFEYSTKKVNAQKPKSEEPYITIYNNENRKDVDYVNSYIFLSRAAVKLLQSFGKTEKVKVGIDTETQKIVVIPDNLDGRRLSIQTGGSAQVSVKNLITENKIPTQTCTARAYDKYARGGIIFDYVMTTK